MSPRISGPELRKPAFTSEDLKYVFDAFIAYATTKRKESTWKPESANSSTPSTS